MSIELKQFVESGICASREHCETCRSRERGEQFRAAQEKYFIVPKDWECPFGVPWDFKPPTATPYVKKKLGNLSEYVNKKPYKIPEGWTPADDVGCGCS